MAFSLSKWALGTEGRGQFSMDQRKKVWGLIALVFAANVAMSIAIKPGHEEYRKAEVPSTDYKTTEADRLRGTPFQALLATALGVREVLASLMWVRADDYFHRGQYRPIIQMIHQITTIDPHQIDVYATGAWHMAYNFMDKRLIEDGVKFLDDGCRNNRTVYDLFFEKGYMHYDKTKDFPKAVEAYRESSRKGTTGGDTVPPSYVRHQLAHALEKMGDIDQALTQWEDNLRVGREQEKLKGTSFGPAGPNVQAARHNLYITARRRNERLAAMAERQKNAAEALRLWQANLDLANDWLRDEPRHGDILKDRTVADAQVARLKSGKIVPLDPAKIDVRFTVTRMQPREIQVTGHVDVLNLSRIRVQLEDEGYDQLKLKGFDYKMSNLSREYENVSINKGVFKYTFKLNKDPADMGRPPEEIYPLKSDRYTLMLEYNPRLQAAFIQDRYGWNGEGLTADQQYLVEDEPRAGVVEGKRYPLRLFRRQVTLTREDLTGPGKKVIFTNEAPGAAADIPPSPQPTIEKLKPAP